jgi:hypothetical protein
MAGAAVLENKQNEKATFNSLQSNRTSRETKSVMPVKTGIQVASLGELRNDGLRRSLS